MAKKSYTVVAALLFDKQGNVLITRRLPGSHLGGLWEFPGGTVEKGETRQQALIREIKEEIDLNISVAELYWHERFEYDIKMVDISFYICRMQPTKQKIRLLQAADFRWLDPEELDRRQFPPADAALIEKLLKKK